MLKTKFNQNLFYFIIIILITLFTYRGFISGDGTDWLPMQERIVDEGAYENDWYVNLAEGYNVRTNFNLVMSGFIMFFANNAKIAYIFAFVLFSSIFIFSTYNLTKLIIKSSLRAKLITLFIFLYGSGITLSRSLLVRKDLAAQTVALIFGLIGLFYFFKNSFFISSIFYGISSLFHLAVSFHLFLLSLLYLMYFYRKDIHILSKKLILILPGFLIFFINGIIITLLNKGTKEGLSHLVLEAMKFRAKGFFFLEGISFIDYLANILFFICFIYCIKKTEIKKEYKEKILFFIYSIVAIIILTFFIMKFSPFILLVKLNLFRTSIYAYLFMFMIIGNYLIQRFKESKKISTKIFFALIPLGFIYTPFYIISSTLILTEHLVSNKNKKRILIFLPLIFASLIYQPILTAILTNLKEIILFIIFPTILLYFSYLILEQKQKIANLLIIILLILTTLQFSITYISGNSETPHEKVYDFIRENTNNGDIILFPPHLHASRVHTKRAIVANFKSMPYRDEDIIEWHDRIKTITKNNLNIRQGYSSLTEKDTFFIKNKYNISYIVFEKEKELNYPVVYEDNSYKVFKI